MADMWIISVRSTDCKEKGTTTMTHKKQTRVFYGFGVREFDSKADAERFAEEECADIGEWSYDIDGDIVVSFEDSE